MKVNMQRQALFFATSLLILFSIWKVDSLSTVFIHGTNESTTTMTCIIYEPLCRSSTITLLPFPSSFKQADSLMHFIINTSIKCLTAMLTLHVTSQAIFLCKFSLIILITLHDCTLAIKWIQVAQLLQLYCLKNYLNITIVHSSIHRSVFELARYALELKIPDFRGVFNARYMAKYPSFDVECGIVNFNTGVLLWEREWKNLLCFIWTDIQQYLKTGNGFDRGKELIQRNTDIVPAASIPVCGHLCLFVLKSLANGEEFQSILNHMQHYGYPQGDWKDSV